MPRLQGRKPVSRWIIGLLSIGISGLLIVAGVPGLRYSALRAVGWALVAEDSPAKAELIVISADSQSAGIIEAADLFRAGYATRVAIFDYPPTRAASELARRGAQPFDLEETSLRLLHELSVTDVVVIPAVAGTVDEGKILQNWCAANSVHSILFVSVPDHSRRTRRVLNRALAPQGVEVTVRYARFSEFDPDTWWLTRGGQRTQVVESEKLLLDLLSHPF